MKLDVETMLVGLRAEMSVQEIARRAGISWATLTGFSPAR